MAERDPVAPAGRVWGRDADGYPIYFDPEFGCVFHPVVWAGDQVIYALQPKQWECLQLTPLMRPPGAAGPTWIGYGGAAGGAKSHTARAIAAVVAHRWPGSTSIIFRKTEKEVLENHVQKFRGEVPDFVNGRRFYSIKGEPLAVHWHNGSRTLFGHLRHDDDVFKYQGNEYDAIIFEEGTHYTWFQVIWLTGNRLRASVQGSTPFVLIPTNPGNVGHTWFKRLFIDRRFGVDEEPEDYAFLQAKLEHNFVLRKRDPRYIQKLNTLPEPHRSWLRDGDFAAGAGAALSQLARRVHWIKPFAIPRHWTVFGAFDWGFEHPWSFGLYAVNEDGIVYKVDTMRGRRMQVPEIIERILHGIRMRGVDPERLTYVAAGHDAWHEHKARGENIETIAERMLNAGIPVIKANISRIAGLQQLREYLSWRERGPLDAEGIPTPGDPGLYFFDTPGNEFTWQCLETRVPDPDNIEDVLKTDADEFGEGGDDEYDETRYATASRPARAPSIALDEAPDPWSKEVLEHESRVSRTVRNPDPLPAAGLVDPMYLEEVD